MFLTEIQSGVCGSHHSKIDEWYDEQMEGEHKDLRREMCLNMNSFDNMLRKVTPHLATKRDGLGKPRIDVEKRVAVPI